MIQRVTRGKGGKIYCREAEDGREAEMIHWVRGRKGKEVGKGG
jgi:hypothetical protein